MIGFFCAVREGVGFVLLVLAVVYTVKFAYLKQDPATWDSWRFDDNFFIILPIAAGGLLMFARPWMLLLLSSQHLHNDLNLGYKARIATALAGLLGLLLVVLPFIQRTRIITHFQNGIE